MFFPLLIIAANIQNLSQSLGKYSAKKLFLKVKINYINIRGTEIASNLSVLFIKGTV